MIPRDTTPEAQAVQDRIWREMGVARRFAVASSLSNAVRNEIKRRIRGREPLLPEPAVHLRMIEELYGPLPRD